MNQEPEKKVLDVNKAIKSYLPAGADQDSFTYLIKQLLGVDKAGNPRPTKDLLFFLHVCKRTGLDPVSRQIFPVFRWDSSKGQEVMTIQTGIDGMRAIAQMTGQFAGEDDAVFDTEKEAHPNKATVTVWKIIKGEKVATIASARWAEYLPPERNRTFWDKMPYLMLSKCAEALALRKAFPQALSGIYADVEMEQDDGLTLPKPEKTEVPKELLEKSADKIKELNKELK